MQKRHGIAALFNVWSPLERLVSIVWTSINAPVYKNSSLNFLFSVSKMLKEIKHLPSIHLSDLSVGLCVCNCLLSDTDKPAERSQVSVRQTDNQTVNPTLGFK